MTDPACLGINVLCPVNFSWGVRKFRVPAFIVNPYIFDPFLVCDIFDYLINVIPGIDHHGIMGSEQDGFADTVCHSGIHIDPFRSLVGNAEIRPDGYSKKADAA